MILFVDSIYDTVIKSNNVLPFRFLVDKSYINIPETAYLRTIRRGKSVRNCIKELLYEYPTEQNSSLFTVDREIDKAAYLILELFMYPSIFNSFWDLVYSKNTTNLIKIIFTLTPNPMKVIDDIDYIIKSIEYNYPEKKYDGLYDIVNTSKILHQNLFGYSAVMYEMVNSVYKDGYYPRPYSNLLVKIGNVRLGMSAFRIINRVFPYPQYDYNFIKAALLPLVQSWRDFGLRDDKTWLIDYPNNF